MKTKFITLFLSLVFCFCFTHTASATSEADFEVLDSVYVDTSAPDFKPAPHVTLLLKGTDLYMTYHHTLTYKDPEPGMLDEIPIFEVGISNSVISLTRHYSPTGYSRKLEDVISFKYVVHNVTPGAIYDLDFNFVPSGRKQGKYLIEEGKEIELWGTGQTNLRTRNPWKQEWVVSSATEDDPDADFFRLRLEDTKDFLIKKILMCQGDKFEPEKAVEIARIKNLRQVFSRDVDIPSTFWGKGLPEAYYNPTDWPGFENIKKPVAVYVENYSSDTPRPFSFYNFFTGKETIGYCHQATTKMEKKPGDDKWFLTESFEITGTPSGSDEDGSESWRGEWIEGIGAVGDWYASNLPYPVYNLPKDVTPARVLYVYNYTTGEIVYGDTALDPSWLDVSAIAADNAPFDWDIDRDSVSVSSSEKVTLSLFGLDGSPLAKSDSGHLTLTALGKGVYIIRADAGNHSETRKIIR